MAELFKIDGEKFSTENPLGGNCEFICTDCSFDEGALKSCKHFFAEQCEINGITGCNTFTLTHCKITGDITANKKAIVRDSDVTAKNFCAFSHNVSVIETSVTGDDAFCGSDKVYVHRMELRGKNAYRGVKNVTLEKCKIDSVDALNDCVNVTVINSVIICERLCAGSKNIVFKNCTIVGEQPFCDCKNVRLYDCVLQNSRGAFRGSDVRATLREPIDSIVDPLRGTIVVPAVGELIRTSKKSKAKIMLTASDGE